MMEVTHQTPSVGRLTKLIIAINPALSVHDVIDIIRQSEESRGSQGNDFESLKVINEQKALRLARSTVHRQELRTAEYK